MRQNGKRSNQRPSLQMSPLLSPIIGSFGSASTLASSSSSPVHNNSWLQSTHGWVEQPPQHAKLGYTGSPCARSLTYSQLTSVSSITVPPSLQPLAHTSATKSCCRLGDCRMVCVDCGKNARPPLPPSKSYWSDDSNDEDSEGDDEENSSEGLSGGVSAVRRKEREIVSEWHD